MNLQWTHSFWTDAECLQMHVYIQYSLTFPLFLSLMRSICFLIFCLLFVLPLPPRTPHLPQHEHGRCRMYYQCACVCVCMCAWPTVPLLKAPYTMRTSLSDLPHLLSRQVVSTPGGELSSSLCLSVALDLSLPHLFHTHMDNSHTCAHTPLCQDTEHLLLRHLPECRLTDISHPAVTNDDEEQGQRCLSCPLEPWRAFGLTLLWSLQKSIVHAH